MVAVSGELDPLFALDILEGFVDADSQVLVCLDVDDGGSTVGGGQVAVVLSHVVVAAEGVEVFQLVSSLCDHDPGEFVFLNKLFLGHSVKFQPLGGDIPVAEVVAGHLLKVVGTSEDSWYHHFKYYI